jgi:hypothetical protein
VTPPIGRGFRVVRGRRRARRGSLRPLARSALAFLRGGGRRAVEPILAVRGRPAEDERAPVLERELLHEGGRLAAAPAVRAVDARAVFGEIAQHRRAALRDDEFACRSSGMQHRAHV